MKQYMNVYRKSKNLFIRELINGKEERRKVAYQPFMFKSSQSKTEYQNFYQNGYVQKVIYPDSYSMSQDLKKYKEISGDEMFIWGSDDIACQFIYTENYDTFDTKNIIISILDIEVCTRFKNDNGEWVDGGFPDATNADYPINAICDYRTDDQTYYVFTTASGWTKEVSQLPFAEQVKYCYCHSERELIQKWLTFWNTKTPHVVSGWNSGIFDIPYIINRIKNVFDEKTAKKLSPWNIIDITTTRNTFGQEESTYKIAGIAHLDYLDLYKKYRYKPREKYTLDFISKCELKDEHKLEFNGTHGTLYYDDPVFFVDYNIQDVRCIVMFEKLLKFIDLACYLSYFAKVNFEDNFSPIKIWENLIYTTALDKHIAVPHRFHIPERQSFEGAYVHNPETGLKGCIASFDFTSLYPSILRQWTMGADVIQFGKRKQELRTGLMKVLSNNINDPDCKEMYEEIKETGIFNNFYINHTLPTVVTQYLKDNNVTMTTNVEFFDITKDSVVVELVTKLFKERKSDKKTSFNHKHTAQNIAQELEKRGITV